MNITISRGRLLAGAAFGLGLALVPQQAQAQCVVSPTGTPVAGTVTCADTTTTDTTYAGVSPADDRNYEVDTSTVDFTGTVTAGSVVDGNGLAFTNTVGGANDLNVVNDGTIQVDAGNAPTVPGQGALRITGTGATDINYSGTGSITNLGVAGFADGLLMTTSGTGNITADVGGDVTAVGPSSWGINAFHGGTGGDVSVTTATGTAIQAGERGISTQILNAGSTGAINVVNNASIGSPVAALNTLDFGIVALNTGTGAVSVTNNGAIGAAGDRVQTSGIDASISNVASAANLTVDGSGAIFSAGTGISAVNAGTGAVILDHLGAVDTTGATGVLATSTGGDIDATLGAVTATGGVAIDLNQTDAAGAGIVSLTTTGDIAASTTAIDIDNAGTGPVTVAVDGSIAADAGDAVNVSSTNAAAGAIGITTTAGETLAVSGGDGIEVDTAGTGDVGIISAADITSGAGGVGTLANGIIVTSTGTGGIDISNTGAIGATGDGALLTGITAEITNAASAGTIDVFGTGDIFAVGNGIDVSTLGTGAASVVYGGDVTSTTGNAVEVDTTTGAITVATGGVLTADVGSGIVTTSTTGNQAITVNDDVTADVDGVSATSTTGTIAVTANGDVTGTTGAGIYVTSDGARTVTVGSGSTVTGDYGIRTSGTGTTTVTNSGTVTGTNGIAIYADSLLDGAVTVNNLASGTINGTVDLTNNDDVVTNAGVWNALGSQEFFLGLDTVTNEATGVINTDATTAFNGLETFDNAGELNAEFGLLFDGSDTVLTNTGDINAAGTIDFGAGTDDFANDAGGVFNLTGDTMLAGLETFSNDGTINLDTFVLTGPPIAFDNTGTITTGGDAAVAGFTTFSNSGTLDLAAGTFTVLAGVPFVNTGDIIAVGGATTITGQSLFDNQGLLDLVDGATNDTLTIDSDFVGSGASTLAIDFSGADADLLVINGAASGSTDIDANYLGGFNLDGVLVVDAVTSTANAFVLGSVTGDSPLLDVSLVQAGADYFLVAAPTASAFDPLAVPVFATTLWYQSADEIFAETVKPATTTGFSFWGNGYYHNDKFDNDTDAVVFDGAVVDADIYELDMKRYGIQMGADYGFGGGRVGLTGGYAWANADNDGDFSDLGLDVKGWNIGVYGQFGGITGFHGEFLAKHDRYDAKFDEGAFDGEKFDIRSTGIDGSLGYRFGLGGINLDAHAGISHVRTKVDDIEAYGFNYDIKKLTSTRGRAGVRAIFGAGGLAPYVDATVYREFDGDGEVELFDGTAAYDLDTEGRGTWVRLEAGLSGNNGPGPILAAWGDLGDRQGLGLRAGWRFGGRVAEALPPPPPVVSAPPPPPPPATQTCPDGSVVLATDMCPPPPPPPPPPPEPERG